MTEIAEIASALLTSLVCFVSAYRIRWARSLWMALGLSSVVYAALAAHELSRQDNGLLLSAAVPLFTAPLFALMRYSRVSFCGLAILVVTSTGYAGWSEFISPVVAQNELDTLKTRFNSEGVCIQSTSYTCGPAAAVTLLRRLGIKAEEGEIGKFAKSNPLTGTDAHDLATALDSYRQSSGLRADYFVLDSLDALARQAPALTVVKYGNIGHWITVLEVNSSDVFFADPHDGLHRESRSEFAGRWENDTVTLRCGTHPR